ncbi:ras-specific guanine nucleotide-releasing factor RalGPS2-like isoform X3 [Scyliorhinus canicula]|uniref:ras-specific guanine nucleotide-releasing factor RalGPS2-like isoform X3 n=1 Tax=Scyliorhinus canicula TaxID=7830 RepID=UPI0018F7C7C8|nr:ras-specific guanine nucleotide-releasing factor RalGPS2-like isoform X3 [Scyliorhinus canicula]
MEMTQGFQNDTESDLELKRSSSVASAEKGARDLRKSFDAVVFDVLMVSPEQFASQITQLDIPVFRAIQPEELSGCRWNKREKRTLAPNVVAFSQRFNKISFWVSREIVTKQNLKIRVKVLGHFIKIAKLQDLQNLHGLMAVISALQSAPVFRLSQTWALLSRKDKVVFEKLEILTSQDYNYKELRDYIKCLKLTPCIPYLGTYLSDLTYIDAAYPLSQGALRNKHRCDQINNVLRIICDLQQTCEYDLPTLPHVLKYLNSERYIEELQGIFDRDNHGLSLMIEPPPCLQHHISKREFIGFISPSEATESSESDTTVMCLCLMRGHRKWHSINYNCCYRARRVNNTGQRSASFPGSRSRSLLDDSVMDEESLWMMRAVKQPAYEHSTASREKSLDVGVGNSRSSFEGKNGFYPPLGPMMRLMSFRRSLVRSTRPENSRVPPHEWDATIESTLRRKTILKDGKKPTVSLWTTYWVSLCESQMLYYGAKSLKSTERNQFKSSWCKRESVTGWMPLLMGDPDVDVFQLSDPERAGNCYLFHAGSKVNAARWFRHLSMVCKTDRKQVSVT